MDAKKWKIWWQPSVLESGVSIQETHNLSLSSLHQSYPLLKRDNSQSTASNSTIPTITNNICSTLPQQNIQEQTLEEITNYNEDLQVHKNYIESGCKLYDGVENLRKNVVVAVAPPRANGTPWFGRVIDFNEQMQEIQVRWMDKLQNKTTYFYLTEKEGTIHFETVICNGIQFEPLLQDTLTWKLLTPLAFIQSMNNSNPPKIQQNNTLLTVRPTKKKFDLTKMLFANSVEFLEFVNAMQ